MNKKTILKFNSNSSIRPFAWLALAILAVGAFGNSVQAQAWLNEDFSLLGAGANLAVGGNCVAFGTPGYATGATGGGALKIYKTTTATGSVTEARWSLSDASYTTARPSGYISFKVQQPASAASTGLLYFRLGSNDGNTLNGSSAAWLETRFYNRSYLASGVASATANFMTYGGGTKILNNSINNVGTPVKIEIWYNNTGSPMNYRSPATQAIVALNNNSFVIYAGNVLTTTAATGNPFPATVVPAGTGSAPTSTTIGKFSFTTPEANTSDFIVDDLYAGSSAPLAILSSAPAPIAMQSNFTYTILTTAVSGVNFTTTSTLPQGLTLNSTTGVISGIPTTSGTYPITVTATATGQTAATATLTIEVTAVPTVYTWNNSGTNWSSGTSWTNGTAPATSALIDTAQFGSLNGPATGVNVGSGNTIKGIVFDAGAYAYSWTGADIKVLSSGAITNNSSVTQTFANKMINSGNATWSSVASGSSMVFNGGIDLSDSSTSNTLTFAGAGNATVGGVIANGGGSTGGAVTFTSTGTNLLSGNNTYGGATTIGVNSTLKIGSTTALGSTSGSTVVSLGGVLDLNGQTISDEPLTLEGTGISSAGALVNTSVTNASWSGPVTLVSAATYMNASSGKITVSGVVSGGSKGIYKIGRGTLELSGANTYTGTTTLTDGTMILSGSNSGAAYTLSASADSLNPVLKLSATNVMSSSATLTGSSSLAKSGTVDFATAGDYTLNQYNIGNMNFANSSGSPATLTFTNLNNVMSSGGGRTLSNLSTNLTVKFSGSLDIFGTTNDSCTFAGIGPVVISNRVYSSSLTYTRGLTKKDAGTLTIYGVNSYNGTTTVSGGTLVIPNGGSLTNCSNTIVKGSGTTSATSASLNLGGAAGVVQVSTNGFVRGDTNGSTTTLGTISSLQVQSLGTVEVALGTTWSTGGTIDFASGSKVSVTGTAPVTGSGPYTLMTASTDFSITSSTPTLNPAITGWNLNFSGANLILEETPLGQFEILEGTRTFSAIISGGIILDKMGDGTAIISGANTFTGGTVLRAGTLEVGNSSGLGTGAVTLTSGTLRSTVDLDLGKLVESTTAISAGFQAVYGGASSRLRYTTGQPTTINGPVTLEVGDGYTMTMGTLIGNSSPSSLVTKIGAGTVKLMGESTKLADAGMALDGNASSVLGGWRIEGGTVWFAPSANNGGGNGPITLAGGSAKFSKLQNSNATYTGFEVPSDLTVTSSGLIQFDPDPLTLLGQNRLGFKNLSIGANTLTVATGTVSTVVGQGLPSVNFPSATLTGSATLNNPANLDLNLQAVSGTAGFTKTGLGTLYLSDQPNRAAAFAALTGTAVASINVEYAGSGYLVAPIVTVVPVNGGSGALATATIDSNGRVTSIAVTAAGSGYVSVPRVVIAAPPTVATVNSYAGATIVDQGKLNLSGSYASSVTVKLGAALQLDWLAPAQAKCSIDGISPISASPNAAYSYVKNLYLTKSVGGYQPGTFEFNLPAPAKVDGSGTATGTSIYVLAAARARATVDSAGFISALEILNGGSGYAITPMVTIPAPTVPTVVARTTGSITFETGAQLSVKNAPIGAGASCTLLTADQGILGAELPSLLNLPGYALTKSSDGNSLILTDMRTDPMFSSNPMAGAITYGQSLAPSNLNSAGLTSVPGSFSWKNAGTLLPAGTSSQIVTFTPTDLTAYRPAEFTVSVTVSKASLTPVFSGSTSPTYDGTAKSLSASTTPATIVNLTYDGSDTAPTSVGIYSVLATISDANYQGSATTSLMIGRAAQTITFGSLSPVTYAVGATVNLAATASSGLEVSYASSDTSVATVSGSTVTILKAGSTIITASQAGGVNYNAAPAVPQTLTVNRADHAITFGSLPPVTYAGGATVNLAATASSGLEVSYASSDTSVATVSGSTVTILKAGSTIITASQAGDVNYNAAVAVPRTLTVNPAGTIYNDWLTANGGTASDAAFLDYVFGAATPGALPASLKPTVAVTGGNLVLTYYVRQGTLGLTVTAQTSANLATGAAGWGTSEVINGVGTTSTVNGVSVQQRTASVSVSGGKKFLRIQAVQAAP